MLSIYSKMVILVNSSLLSTKFDRVTPNSLICLFSECTFFSKLYTWILISPWVQIGCSTLILLVICVKSSYFIFNVIVFPNFSEYFVLYATSSQSPSNISVTSSSSIFKLWLKVVSAPIDFLSLYGYTGLKSMPLANW